MTYRGFSLVEVLVGGAIAGVILIGNLHSLKFSMQAGAVSKSILTENDFRLTVSNALDKNCQNNLQPLDADKEKTVIPVTSLRLKSGEPNIIEVGIFKNDIEVVKMEVRAQANTDTSREFFAYYKKTNLGDLNTVAGKKCEKTGETYKLDGCFRTQCKLNYELGDDPTTTPETETGYLAVCESLTCHPVVLQVAGGIGPKCPWGEIWKNNKCDKREKKNGSCDKPSDSVFLENFDGDKTGRTADGDKCVCKEVSGVKRVLTAEGLCIKKQQEYNWFSCWPRVKEDGSFDFDPDDLDYGDVGASEENIKNFCSNKYQGQEVCIRSIEKSLNESICNKRGKTKTAKDPDNNTGVMERSYYKRVYNRETGQVSCLRFIQCVGATPPPSAEWLIPQIQ